MIQICRQAIHIHTTIDSKCIHDFTPGLQVGVGNLSGNIEKWKDIGANEYIIDVIENEYRIPFYTYQTA